MNQIIDAIAEWDDRGQTFRVYLTREGQDESQPMEARLTEETIESRLYRAAFMKCYKDFLDKPHERVLGFEKEAAAKRVAKAVNAELKRVAKGEPGPTLHQVSMTAQIAGIMSGKKRR